MLNRYIIRKHIVSFTILLFVAIFTLVVYLQPSIFYKRDGTLREFGINQSNKTVIPIWLFVICISIVSYLSIMFYLIYPRIKHRVF